jgi:hypothetical protein
MSSDLELSALAINVTIRQALRWTVVSPVVV